MGDGAAAAGRAPGADGSAACQAGEIGMTDRDLGDWDREIEAEFQRVVAAGKRVASGRRGRRHVGFPWAFFVDACRLTKDHTTLIVALYVYRRTRVCNSQTVTLPNNELAELGVDRSRKCKALAKLEAVGLIRTEKAAGRSTRATLTWQPG